MDDINQPPVPQQVEQPAGIPIYDISGSQPVLGHIDHSELQDAILSGKYSLPQGTTIPVLNPDGELGHMDSAEAPQAFANGYQYATPHDIANIHYGTPLQQGITALEGFSKGLAGPAATFTENKLLGIPEEEIRARAEANPITHTTAEIAGFAAPAIASLGASTLGRLGLEAGAQAVPKIAKLAEFTQAGLIDKAAEGLITKLGVPVGEALVNAKPLVKIGSSAAKLAADNAIYQIGNEMSSAILQDPNQDLGSAAIDIGLAGLIGGAAGGAIGSVSPLWEATAGSKAGTILKAIRDRMGGVDSVVPNAAKDALEVAGIGDRIAPEVRAGMTQIPELKESFNTLMQRDTTKSGKKLQEAVGDFHKTANETIANSFGKTTDDIVHAPKLSEYETGQSLGKSLADEVDSNMKPIAKAYEDIKNKYGKLELPGKMTIVDDAGKVVSEAPSAISRISEDLSNLATNEGWVKSPSSPEMHEINRVLKELPLQTSVDDISNFIKLNNGKIQSDPLNGALRNTLNKINGILRNAEADAIAVHLGKDSGAEALQAWKETRQAFAKQAELTDMLDSRLKIKGSTTSSYGNAIRELASDRGEALLRKLTPQKDASLVGFLQDNYPKTADAIRQYHLDNLLKQAVDGDQLNSTKLLKKMKALSPEMQNFIIPKEAMAKTEAVGTLLDMLKDKHFNYSSTARVMDKLQSGMVGSVMGTITGLLTHNPITALIMGPLTETMGKHMPDAARLSLLKYLGSGQEISANGFKAMFDMISHTLKGENLAGRAAKGIFKGTTAILPQYLYPTQNDRNRIDKQLEKLKKQPQDQLAVGGNMGHYLPEHAAALGATTSRAMQYLDSLKPKTSGDSVFQLKVKPNAMQEANYNKALDIAQQPLIVLDKIQKGTITPDDVKHLQNLYPGLYQNLSQKVINAMLDHAGKGETVPYKVRLGVSLFTGMHVDSTMNPQSIMAAQPTPAQQPQQNAQGSTKHSTKGLDKIAQNAMTPGQARESHNLKN